MKRTIRVLCLKDDHEGLSFDDHGVDRDGVPTSRRQLLMRALSKRDAFGIPIFRIVEVGAWQLRPGEAMPAHDEFHQFDSLWLEHRAPDDAWLKARAKYVAKKRDAADDAARDLQRRMGASIGEAMTSLAASIAANAALPGAAPSAPAKSGGKGAP